MAKLREYTKEEDKVSVEEKSVMQERITQEENRISEAERVHNAQISERYWQLKNIVDDQFATKTVESPIQHVQMHAAPAYPTYGYTPEVEQNPKVTEYIRNLKASIYQAESYEVAAPVMQQEVAEPEVVNEIKTVAQESYGLTTFGKLALGIFAAVVVTMVAMIGANTKMLEQKSMRIDELQMQRQTLIEENAAVQRRIADAQSEETIRQYAESQGMVRVD